MKSLAWWVGLTMLVVAASARPVQAQTSAGQNVSVQRIWSELKRQYVAGGSTMHFISALSVLGVAFVLERLFRLRRGVVAPAGLARQAALLWRQGRLADLEQLGKTHEHSTLGKAIVFVAAHPRLTLEQVTNAVSDIASRDVARHLMYLMPLAMVAVLAPLLGLFGTVIGMIESFETVAVAGTMGDPSLLSSSISKALITTAYGLVVAMPILFCYHMIKLRTALLTNTLEEEASTMLNEMFLPSAPPSAAATPVPAAPAAPDNRSTP